MIISDSYKFVFHHVPKTGGSSITAALAPYSRNYEGAVPTEETHGWQTVFHQPYFMHHPVRSYEAGAIPEGYYSFAFVRNPFDAVVSAYNPTKYKHFDEYVEEKLFTIKPEELNGVRGIHHISQEEDFFILDACYHKR